MKKRLGAEIVACFLCLSFLLMMDGSPGMAAERSIPLGQMVSQGVVQFEARGNIWKNVEPSYFPIFPETKVRTERGVTTITLSSDAQIEVRPNGLFFFDQKGRFILPRGSIEFRIPSGSELDLTAGDLSVTKSRTLYATKASFVSPEKDEERVGSVSIHPSGAVTVKSIQGRLSILSKDRVVLATLSSKETVTIPPMTAGEKQKIRVAQVGDPPASDPVPVDPPADPPKERGGILGLSAETWTWIGIATVGVGAGTWAISGGSHGDGTDRKPICR
jgi:hypothetical protein